MKNWKIGTRIVAGFACIIFITALLAVLSYSRLQKIQTSENELVENAVPSMNLLRSVAAPADAQVTLLLAHTDSTNPREMSDIESKIVVLRATTRKTLAQYAALPASDDEEKTIDVQVMTARTSFFKEADDMLRVGRGGGKAAKAKAKHILDYRVRPAKSRYDKVLAELVDYNMRRVTEELNASTSAVTVAKRIVIVCAIFAVVLSIPIVFYIVRSITVPLAKIVAAFDQLGKCDLTTTLEHNSEDEIGQMARSLNQVIAELRGTVLEVTSSASHANTAARELSAAAGTIASGTQQQAASLEETSASLEEITGTLHQSADNMRQANQLASSSRLAAEQGQEVVSNAVGAMGEIDAASGKIADIISTIDEIAFQTNLLAVNAAVEAANAGEQGRGFAVVAAEVRSLAQRSAGAAKEIKVLIQDTLQKVERGTALVNKSGETLRSIVGSVKKVTDIIGEISAASDEQSIGVDQVNAAMSQIDHVTQSNAAQTQELSSTAQMLAEQSEGLMKIIAVFKVDMRTPVQAAISVANAKTRPTRVAAPKAVVPLRIALPAKAPRRSGVALLQRSMPVMAGNLQSDSFEEF
jgi:methyl-accepting chemotaxis protein